jgi:hypothetical protein
MSEAPSNRWPVNQAALKWLREAKVFPEEDASYMAQLAWWGLEKGGLEVWDPIAPSQPSPDNVELLVQTIYGMDADKASRFILSNPNLSFKEQRDNLARLLEEATSPQDAAWAVIEALYDLMVAENETYPD